MTMQWSEEKVWQIMRNLGADPECAGCAQLAMTGTPADHTCKRKKELSAEDQERFLDAPYSIGSMHCPGISKLEEEMAEALQVVGKILGLGGFGKHWDGHDLKRWLEEEIGDVVAAIAYVVAHNKLDDSFIGDRSIAKLARFEGWHADAERRRRERSRGAPELEEK